jgi:hypothetical protein
MRERTTIRVALLDHLIRADADLLEGFRDAVALQIGHSRVYCGDERRGPPAVHLLASHLTA